MKNGLLCLVLCLLPSVVKAQPQPLGDPPPPAGMQWVLTFDDEFANDGRINTGVFNGGAGGGVPWCNGNVDALNQYSTPPGGSCAEYYGTPGVSPWADILPGVGLRVMAFVNPSTLWGNWMGLQTYGKFVQQYGYWEAAFKEPTDNAGEGDGLHTDIWITPPCRTDFGNNPNFSCQDEIDIAEDLLGPSNQSTYSFGALDANSFVDENLVNTGKDLSASFNVAGMSWVPDSNQGAIQGFFNGHAVTSPFSLKDAGWSQGAWMLPGWMQQAPFSGLGGVPVDGGTSNNNPFYIKYIRVWQAVPIGSTPSPTPIATPTPTSSCALSITSPVGTQSPNFKIHLNESNCGGNYNRAEFHDPFGVYHVDFQGTSLTQTDMPAGNYQVYVTAWSDGSHLDQIGQSNTVQFSVAQHRGFNTQNSPPPGP